MPLLDGSLNLQALHMPSKQAQSGARKKEGGTEDLKWLDPALIQFQVQFHSYLLLLASDTCLPGFPQLWATSSPEAK